jgi:hypothetical protein
MSSVTADGLAAAAAAIPADDPIGPLEQKHLQFAIIVLSPTARQFRKLIGISPPPTRSAGALTAWTA